MKPSEHKTVQNRILAYAQEIGWTFVSREEAEKRREIGDLKLDIGKGSLFFEDLLHSKVQEFNPRYAEAEGALLGKFPPSPRLWRTSWHLHTDIYGKPMEPVTLEQLQAFNAPMFSRNPRLHAVFNTMELAEERGLGLRSMRERTRQVGLALPNYAWNEPYLDLTLYRAAESATKSLDDAVLGELNATERRGWTFIASRGTTTQNEYSREIGVTARTAQRHLGNFVDLGLLRRIGSGPATEYQIIQP